MVGSRCGWLTCQITSSDSVCSAILWAFLWCHYVFPVSYPYLIGENVLPCPGPRGSKSRDGENSPDLGLPNIIREVRPSNSVTELLLEGAGREERREEKGERRGKAGKGWRRIERRRNRVRKTSEVGEKNKGKWWQEKELGSVSMIKEWIRNGFQALSNQECILLKSRLGFLRTVLWTRGISQSERNHAD